MRHGTRETIGLLLVAALGAWARPTAAAQPTPIRPVGITSTGGDLFLRADIRDKTESSAGGIDVDERERFFEESLELRGRGYIYHPNLLDWSVDLRLGLTQQLLRIDSEDRDSEGELLGYTASALILKEKPVSVYVFGSRSDEIINRDFARSIDLEVEREGVELTTKGPVPLTLRFERSRLRELSDVRLDEEETWHAQFALRYQPDADRRFELTYDHEETDETITTFATAGAAIANDVPDTLDEVNASTLIRFGSGPEKHRFTGRLQWRSRRGFFPNRLLAAGGALDLVHTDSLTSFYRIDYARDETETNLDRNFLGEAGFTQKIYESLDITGRALLRDRRFSGGGENTVGAFLETLYRKEFPIGRYTCSLLLGRERTEITSETGVETLVGEAVTLTDLLFAPLSRPNVVPGSIVVLNADRTVVFLEGLDYILRTLGARTEISRTATGTIADGETVLVDYEAVIGGDAEFRTDRLNFSNRLDLEKIPLALYYEFRRDDEQLTSGLDPGNLDTEVTHLVGGEVAWEGLRVVIEHERRDQELFPPWRSNRLRLSYTRRLTPRLDLTVGGDVERLVFEDAALFGLEPGRDRLDIDRAYARATAKLARNLLLRGGVEYAHTRGNENRRLFQTRLGLDWRYRDLDVGVEARFSRFQQEGLDGQDVTFRFQLRRRF